MENLLVIDLTFVVGFLRCPMFAMMVQ